MSSRGQTILFANSIKHRYNKNAFPMSTTKNFRPRWTNPAATRIMRFLTALGSGFQPPGRALPMRVNGVRMSLATEFFFPLRPVRGANLPATRRWTRKTMADRRRRMWRSKGLTSPEIPFYFQTSGLDRPLPLIHTMKRRDKK